MGKAIYKEVTAELEYQILGPNHIYEKMEGDIKNPKPPNSLMKKGKEIQKSLVKKLLQKKAPKFDLSRFSKLPAELRVQIWEDTMVPRIISAIRVVNPGLWWLEYSIETWFFHFAERCQLDTDMPISKDVNIESRVEFLKSYDLLSDPAFVNPIHVNMKIDTLYFPTSWCFRQIPREDGTTFKKIQHIAIGFDKDFEVHDVETRESVSLSTFYILAHGREWYRNHIKECVTYPELLQNVLSLPMLKSIKFIPHSEDKHIHTIIVNKCQQDISTGRELEDAYEPWGKLDDYDTKPKVLEPVDLNTEACWDWSQTQMNKLKDLMTRLSNDVNEKRGADVPQCKLAI